MSPELVDQTILTCCGPRFLKVALIIVDVATALKVPMPMEGLFVDVPKAQKKPKATEVDLIVDRIRVLVKAGRLEAAGNLDRWRFSEIRLAGKRDELVT